jgi:hypothetical protein
MIYVNLSPKTNQGLKKCEKGTLKCEKGTFDCEKGTFDCEKGTFRGKKPRQYWASSRRKALKDLKGFKKGS